MFWKKKKRSWFLGVNPEAEVATSPPPPNPEVSFINNYERFLAAHYGERCREREPGCPVCVQYALFDLFTCMCERK